jgi:hypothetical protein
MDRTPAAIANSALIPRFESSAACFGSIVAGNFHGEVALLIVPAFLRPKCSLDRAQLPQRRIKITLKFRLLVLDLRKQRD